MALVFDETLCPWKIKCKLTQTQKNSINPSDQSEHYTMYVAYYHENGYDNIVPSLVNYLYLSRFCIFSHIMCKSAPGLGSESLKMWEKGCCNLTQLAGRFCKSPSLCTQEVGADTQTSGLAGDQRPERRWQQDREKQGGDTQMSSQLQNCWA